MKTFAMMCLRVSSAIALSALVSTQIAAQTAGPATAAATSGPPKPCLSMQNVHGTHTPLDILDSATSCAKKGDYDGAARLFGVAKAYTYFDIDRVADKTVGDMGTLLTMRFSSSMDESQRKQFDQAFHALHDNKASWQTFCAEVQHIGPPTYYPKYMVDHGMNAFIGDTSPDKALKPDFNATAEWKDIQATYLKCQS